MLRIKKKKTYNIPVYPHTRYYRAHPNFGNNTLIAGMTALSLMAITEGCIQGVGPINYYDIIGESEGRAIINKLFNDDNIRFTQNYNLSIPLGQNDTLKLELDGFNDSLDVGFEYNTYDEYSLKEEKTTKTLDSLTNNNGPYIKAIPSHALDERAHLLKVVQNFIDTLKARGII